MSNRRQVVILCAMVLWQLSAGAQALPESSSAQTAALDGPALKTDSDSLEMRSAHGILPMPVLSTAMKLDLFSKLDAPTFETGQQRALRMQASAVNGVMPSVRANLSQSIKPIPYQYLPLLLIAGFFLTPQFSVPYGYYPMMSAGNPFVIAKIPGWAPEQAGMYSPDIIPQTIDLVYDFATGTYKREMVDWKVYEARCMNINSMNFNITPVPRVPINDVERRIMNMGM